MLSNCSICVYKCQKETALLEKILQQSEIKDAEDKGVTVQTITCMELIRIKNKASIPPFDREILNEQLHSEKIGNVWGDPDSLQEYLALGMSKGSVFLLHVRKLNQLYCRFTVHRESVTYIRYLHESDVFISSSRQNDICIWKVDALERNVKVLQHFVMGRPVDFMLSLDNSFTWFNQQKEPIENVETLDLLTTEEEELQITRIWIAYASGDQELF